MAAALTFNEMMRDYYKKQLVLARIQKSEKPIGNRLPWQATMATKELLVQAVDLATTRKSAKVKKGSPESPVLIRILTGSLPELVFCNGEIIAGLKEFTSLGGEIRAFVITSNVADAKEKSDNLSRILGDRITFRILHADAIESKVPHFAVIGEQGYRLEDPHEPIPPGTLTEMSPPVPARIVFNDPKGAATLARIFDNVWVKLGTSQQELVASSVHSK